MTFPMNDEHTASWIDTAAGQQNMPKHDDMFVRKAMSFNAIVNVLDRHALLRVLIVRVTGLVHLAAGRVSPAVAGVSGGRIRLRRRAGRGRCRRLGVRVTDRGQLIALPRHEGAIRVLRRTV